MSALFGLFLFLLNLYADSVTDARCFRLPTIRGDGVVARRESRVIPSLAPMQGRRDGRVWCGMA
jgi:hypothetical protein